MLDRSSIRCWTNAAVTGLLSDWRRGVKADQWAPEASLSCEMFSAARHGVSSTQRTKKAHDMAGTLSLAWTWARPLKTPQSSFFQLPRLYTKSSEHASWLEDFFLRVSLEHVRSSDAGCRLDGSGRQEPWFPRGYGILIVTSVPGSRLNELRERRSNADRCSRFGTISEMACRAVSTGRARRPSALGDAST
jgi:hypothetical protein